jgi:hypothetical protein
MIFKRKGIQKASARDLGIIYRDFLEVLDILQDLAYLREQIQYNKQRPIM